MSAIRYIAPALAAVGHAAAQSCSVSATTTIQNGGDASAIASCSTFSGSIAIATGVGGDINMDGIQKIEGSLEAKNVSQLTGLSSGTLEVITDSFTLNEVSLLSTLNFARLTDVSKVDWEGLPQLQGLSFTTGLQMVESLSIQNTQLGSLDGINLQVADTVYIANNNYLNDITMQLGNVSDSMVLEANGLNVSAIFPNMKWGNELTFRNCSQVSLPSLATTNGSLGFYANFFDMLSTPNLTNVGGDLSFISNEDMTNFSMPQLVKVGGGLNVANNTALRSIAFPQLETVVGALDFYGNFTNVSLPELSDVRGAFNLQSSRDISEACDKFDSMHGNSGVIKGEYTCKGADPNPQGTGTLPDGTSDGGSGSSSSSSSSSSESSDSGASTLYISGATGVMGVVAAIFGLL